MDTEFDFKPINEGLGFHRKVKPLDAESDSDESFSFSTLGPGTLSQPAVDSNSREQSKGLLSSGGNTTDVVTPPAKKKHNAKSVSDLIAALPPSLDFLLDDSGPSNTPTAPNAAASSTLAAGAAAKTPITRKSPLFSSPSGIATPGAPAAASMASQEVMKSGEAKTPEVKRGFLKMPLGRSDYDPKAKSAAATAAAVQAASMVASLAPTTGAARSASSLDENVAKTFPTVFPHLGSLAGKPAVATVKGPGKIAATTTSFALDPSITFEKTEERPLPTHFGSAILDTLVAIGLGCVLLALALSITNANLLALLESSQTDRETISALALLFIAGGLLYVLAARTFLGATLGEWSYEIRVGNREARSRWYYPMQVVWRGLLVTLTGFIVFPIISTIAGKDVLKYLTGLGLVGVDGPTAAELNARLQE